MNDLMALQNTGKPFGRTVEKAYHHWEAQGRAAASRSVLPAKTSQALTIALSREAGTSGTLVAEEVGRRLKWHVYDQDLLERIAQEMGIRAALLESVDERQQGWLMESIGAMLPTGPQSPSRSFVSESAYVRHLVETVLALGVHGECVIVGRGASFILPRETTLRVRLVAPLNNRIKTLSQTDGLSAKEAARRVQTIGKERLEFVRDHFHKDPADPQWYDLILNSERFTIAARAELICKALREMESARAVPVSKG